MKYLSLEREEYTRIFNNETLAKVHVFQQFPCVLPICNKNFMCGECGLVQIIISEFLHVNLYDYLPYVKALK